MSSFTITRALIACVSTLLLLAGCSPSDDPKAAFPDQTQTQVHLREGTAREKSRIVHYADDKVTPLWAEVTMFNDHVRMVYYQQNLLVRSEEYFAASDGQTRGPLFLKRLYMPDGRNLKSEERYRADSSIEMAGLRNPDGSYHRTFYSPTAQVSKHQTLAPGGELLDEEVYYSNGFTQQRTRKDKDLLIVDNYDDSGFPTESTSKDNYGYKLSRTLYFPHSRQIRIKSEKVYYKAVVTYYRDDGSVEQTWVRNSQTIVIDHLDRAGNLTWRQNLLLHRLRMGAPTQLSDWRVFSTEEFNTKGVLTRRVLYATEGYPKVVYFPTERATDTRFEGLYKVLRLDGTVESVKSVELDGQETLRETHSSQENLREAIDPNMSKMPTEDYSFDPGQMAVFRGPGGY